MDERTNKLIDTYKAQGPLTTGQIGDVFATTPANTPVNAPITSASLQGATPFNLPTITQNTSQMAGSAVQGVTEGLNMGMQGMITAEDKKIADYQAQVQESTKQKQSFIDKLMGKGQAQIEAETTAGIPEKTQALTDITNEYNTKALEYRRMEEAVQKESMLTDVQKNVRLRDISRIKNTELADIGIRQSVAQNNLTTTQGLIDRKIDLEYGDLKDLITYQNDFLENNREDLSKAEVNKFNLLITENTRKYEEGKSIGEFAKTAVSSGVAIPAEAIIKASSAKSLGEATQILAPYLVTPITPSSGGGVNPNTGQEYQSDLDAIIGATLSTIPTKFGQQTFNQEMARARNDSDRISLVAAQVLKGQPAEFKNDFRNQAVGIGMIDKAIAELDKGAQTGAIQAGKQYAANFLGKDYDPALAKINGYITSAIQPYRNSVTGAAWGDQEDAEYQQLFGSIKYSPTELKQRLLQTKELLKSKSAEGLNAFVNPLGYYNNQFQSGDLTPSNNTQNPDDVFDSVVNEKPESSSWIKNAWNGLFN